jgi:hypothetical protein
MQGDGVSGRTLWSFGGHDRDLADLPQRLLQGKQAVGMDAVIVGHQDTHGLQL